MGNEKGYLNGHDKETCKLIWKYPDTDKPPEEWWRIPSVNAKGILIAGSEKSGKYIGIKSEDGKLLWEISGIGLETGCFPAISSSGFHFSNRLINTADDRMKIKANSVQMFLDQLNLE